jgi:hypothetical protein
LRPIGSTSALCRSPSHKRRPAARSVRPQSISILSDTPLSRSSSRGWHRVATSYRGSGNTDAVTRESFGFGQAFTARQPLRGSFAACPFQQRPASRVCRLGSPGCRPGGARRHHGEAPGTSLTRCARAADLDPVRDFRLFIPQTVRALRTPSQNARKNSASVAGSTNRKRPSGACQ